jgi:hypothetical protein
VGLTVGGWPLAVGRLQLAVSGYTLPRALAIVLVLVVVLEWVLRGVVASATPTPRPRGAIRTSRNTPTLHIALDYAQPP